MLIATLALAASAATCIAPTPTALADSLYGDAYFFYVEAEQARPYVSDALHAALERDSACQTDGICAISADPWLDAQEGDIVGKPVARELSRSDTAAEVELCFDVSFGDTAERQCPKLSLLLDANGCWVADDLVAASGTSLRRVFAEYPYDDAGTP